jgi:hypothetical protein
MTSKYVEIENLNNHNEPPPPYSVIIHNTYSYDDYNLCDDCFNYINRICIKINKKLEKCCSIISCCDAPDI